MGFPPLNQNGNIYTASDITYCTVGGQKLALDLYSIKPLIAGSNKPAVIYFHGGGFVEGGKREIDYDVTRVLLPLINDGFLVASIDYRYAPSKYLSEAQDALCAIRFLRYFSFGIGTNQNKIGVFGNSVGG